MPRKPPSPADDALLAAAAARGVRVSAYQLERWRAAGLLPRNLVDRTGPGRGTTSVAPDEALDLAVWLARNDGPGRRRRDVALEAFEAGLPVPEPTVRKAWHDLVADIQLTGEHDTAAPADAEARGDWASEVAEQAAAAAHPVLMPRRIRRIDDRIQSIVPLWSLPEVAALDQGTDVEPVTPHQSAVFAGSALLGGGEVASGPEVARQFRAMLPAGAASPAASWMEHPDQRYGDPADMVTASGDHLIPVGDMREPLAELAGRSSLDLLRAALQAAKEMYEWAEAQCAAVEAELDSGELGEATTAWMTHAVSGLSRMLIVMAIRDRQPSVDDRAGAALMLLFLTDAVRRLPQFVPDVDTETLSVVFPPFLHDLAGLTPPHPPVLENVKT
ncbi:hypothetical protein GCM10009557_12210 [Virgisporangium ochraceum]|uniref:Uncharacterized protein n=1 Tax=Virgisporangium ochraceum TaxID=65505 RepID=A0A8J4A6G9_9ACTN|nr:hypothetical protein [Virgisporangium ochraceum]GIJ75412.1 hypothetical protein Voc01_103290 [Virgisporangium ochraceum]